MPLVAWLHGRWPGLFGKRRSPRPPQVHHHDRPRQPAPVSRIDFFGREVLTPPPSPSPIHDNSVTSQSLMLEVLPLEIRQQIWREVLGGHSFHLLIPSYLPPQNRRLQGLRCISSNPEACKNHECRWERSPTEQRQKFTLFPVLLICKKIYSEAIQILYSSNQFLTSDPVVIQYLPLLILPQRISSIHTLIFHWRDLPRNDYQMLSRQGYEERQHLANYPSAWREIWKNIAAMDGLQVLKLDLDAGGNFWETLNVEDAEELLAPIREITGPKIFVLGLRFPQRHGRFPQDNNPSSESERGETDDPWDTLNCTIRRTNRDWTDA